MTRSDLVGLAQPLHRDVLVARNIGDPLLARLRLILARHEAALPLARVDQSDHHRVDADARREFARQRLHQALRAGARRRGRHHVRLGLVGEQRIHRQDRRCVAAVQQRPEGADRVDLAEEFQLQLFAPVVIGGIREGRHARLPGIGDQDVAAAFPLLDRGGQARDGILVQHVAGHRQQLLFGRVAQQRRLRRGEPRLIAAADRDRGALAQEQARGGQPDARAAPGDDGDPILQSEIHSSLPHA